LYFLMMLRLFVLLCQLTLWHRARASNLHAGADNKSACLHP